MNANQILAQRMSRYHQFCDTVGEKMSRCRREHMVSNDLFSFFFGRSETEKWELPLPLAHACSLFFALCSIIQIQKQSEIGRSCERRGRATWRSLWNCGWISNLTRGSIFGFTVPKNEKIRQQHAAKSQIRTNTHQWEPYAHTITFKVQLMLSVVFSLSF